MNEELKLVLKYCTINKLSVNVKRTNNYYMLITSSKKKMYLNIQILNVKAILNI